MTKYYKIFCHFKRSAEPEGRTPSTERAYASERHEVRSEAEYKKLQNILLFYYCLAEARSAERHKSSEPASERHEIRSGVQKITKYCNKKDLFRDQSKIL